MVKMGNVARADRSSKLQLYTAQLPCSRCFVAPARVKARTFRTGPEARVHNSTQTTAYHGLDGGFSSLPTRCSLTDLHLQLKPRQRLRNGSDLGSRKQAPQNSLDLKTTKSSLNHTLARSLQWSLRCQRKFFLEH